MGGSKRVPLASVLDAALIGAHALTGTRRKLSLRRCTCGAACCCALPAATQVPFSTPCPEVVAWHLPAAALQWHTQCVWLVRTPALASRRLRYAAAVLDAIVRGNAPCSVFHCAARVFHPGKTRLDHRPSECAMLTYT